MLNTKNKRLAYGEIGEKLIYDLFKSKGLNVTWLKVGTNQKTAYQNMQYGDLYLPNTNEYIDVKYTTCITKASADNFIGDYFLLIPNKDIKKAWVVGSKTIKKYFAKIDKFQTTISGAECRYFNTPLYSSIPIMDFVKNRI